MEGYGVLSYKKGKYEGNFEKSLKVGPGVLLTETGKYKGSFVNGEM